MSRAPDTIGRYRILGRIGQGGMGVLFLALDPMLDRQLAIKLLRDDNEELRERFAREARSVARLRHPNIVTIFDVGEQDGQPFIAMEYIQGQTLADIIRTAAPIDVTRKLQIIDELSDGLGFAHKAGIVHRDVKPANVMVEPDGLVKILDFGIARIAESGMTQAGMLIGTLNYMSPEQVTGQVVDGRSDIFAVGAVLYELLTYRQAFPGGLQHGILNKILTAAPPALDKMCPGIDPEIIRIVDRALRKDPDTRYQDMAAMRKDLQRARQRLEEQIPETVAIQPGDADDTVAIEAPTAPAHRPQTPRWGTDRGGLALRRAAQIAAHIEAARRAMDAEDFEGAVAAAEQALLLHAEEPDALEILEDARRALDARQLKEWIARGADLLQQGAYTEALSVADQALTLSPGSSAVRDLRRAIDQARTERARQRERDEAIRSVMERAQSLFDQEAFAEAEKAAGEALALAPDLAGARTLQNKAREAIARITQAALEHRITDALADARQRFQDGDHDDAIAALASFEPEHPRVTGALDELRANAARMRQEREEARLREQAIANAIAKAAAAADHTAAIAILNEALALDAGRADVRGLVDQRQAALNAELKAARRARERAEAVAAAIANAKGTASHEAAIAILADAQKVDPEHADVRALIQTRQAALEAEREEARRVRDLQQKVSAAIAKAQATTPHDAAIAILEEAARLDAGDAEVRRQLGHRRAALEREREEARRTRERQDAVADAVAKAARTTGHPEAIAILNDALALDPERADVRALIDARQSALDTEREEARRTRQREETVAAAIARANSTGAHAAALAVLKEAQTLEPGRDDIQALIEARQSALDAEVEEARRIRDVQQKIAAALTKAKATTTHDAAIAILEEAAALDPGDAEVRRHLADRRAVLEREREEARRARERQEQEEARKVRERQDRTAKAIADATATPSHEAALAILTSALARDPDHQEIAQLLDARRKAADDEARRIRERQEKSAATIAKAKATPAHEAAVALLEGALKLDPQNTGIRELLDARKSALEREREEARRARERREKIAAAIARATATAGHESAVAILKEALAIEPGHEEVRALLDARQAALDREREAARLVREREAKIADIVKQAKATKAHDAAIALVKTALALDGSHPEARSLLESREAALKAAQAEAARLQAIETARQSIGALISKREFDGAESSLRNAEAELQAKKPLKDLHKAITDARKAAARAAKTDAAGRPTKPGMGPMAMGGIAAAFIVIVVGGYMMSRQLGSPGTDQPPAIVQPPAPQPSTGPPAATEVARSNEPAPGPPKSTAPITAPTVTPPAEAPGSAPAPAAPPTSPTAPSPKAASAAQTGRRQLEQGELRQAASTTAGGLKIDPNDPGLHQLASDIAARARTQLSTAKSAAVGRGEAATRSADFKAAQAKEAEARRYVQAKRPILTVGSLVDAAALYARADREAAAALAAAKPSAAPGSTGKPTAPVTNPTPAVETPPPPAPAPTVPPAASNPPASNPSSNPPASSAPAPATPPPPKQTPAQPTVNDEALIKDKISEYARAYSSLDSDAVRKVYPGVTTGLAQTFAGFRTLTMTIVLGPIVVSGSEATVTCQVQQSIQPKVGSRQSPPSQQTTFSLRKTNGQWSITDRKP